MRRSHHRGVAGAVLAGALLATFLPRARADAPPAPSSTALADDDRVAAARSFSAGEEAFAKGDFLRAAALFEEAYARAPHDSSLWNAARSWHRAGELDRAANRYAHFLRDAPATAPDRDAATKALTEIAAKLGRFEVHAPGVTDVRVDGASARLPGVFVYPGAHVISGRVGDRAISRTERVEIGGVTSVVLMLDAPPSSSAAPSASPSSSAALGAPATGSPSASAAPVAPPDLLSGVPVPPLPARVGIIIGGTLSVAMIGFTIASGMDTLAAQRRYDQSPSHDLAVDLADKQRRTWALLGGTIGLVTLTSAAIVWVAIAAPVQGRVASASLTVRGEF